MAKADSNYEEKKQVKRIRKNHMTPHSIILRGDSKKFEYLGENEIKNETILTHWSVRLMKKTWGKK